MKTVPKIHILMFITAFTRAKAESQHALPQYYCLILFNSIDMKHIVIFSLTAKIIMELKIPITY